MKQYHLQIDGAVQRVRFMTWLKARLVEYGANETVSEDGDVVTWLAPADME